MGEENGPIIDVAPPILEATLLNDGEVSKEFPPIRMRTGLEPVRERNATR
jgi:hypothetical protein